MVVKLKYGFWGRKVGFRFDNYAWIKMCDLMGVEFDQLDELTENELVLAWLYGAYYSYCAYNNRRRRLSFEKIAKMYRWYYIHKPHELERVKQAMLKGKVMGRPLEEHYKGEKKKSPSKTSTTSP